MLLTLPTPGVWTSHLHLPVPPTGAPGLPGLLDRWAPGPVLGPVVGLGLAPGWTRGVWGAHPAPLQASLQIGNASPLTRWTVRS